MSNQLMLDVDQAGELKMAFRRTRGSDGSEWTNEDIKKSSEGDFLGLVLDVLDGRAKIVSTENVTRVAVKPNPKVYLRDLYPNETIEFGPDNGTKMLANAKNIFKAGIDSDFVNWGLSKKRSPKDKIQARVCEMVEDGTFGQIFGFLFGASSDEFQNFSEFVKKYREDLRRICVGQGQIEEFVVKHRDKLREDGWGTFFLFENEDVGEFFVARVSFGSGGGLGVVVRRFGHSYVWFAAYRRRLVTPWLA